jgi:hypothetical protein
MSNTVRKILLREIHSVHPEGLSLPELHHRFRAQKDMRVTLGMLREAINKCIHDTIDCGEGPYYPYPYIEERHDVYYLTERALNWLGDQRVYFRIGISQEDAEFLEGLVSGDPRFSSLQRTLRHALDSY